MKKLLLVLAVASLLACNNGGGEETQADTSTTIRTDTSAITPIDTTGNPVPDTTRK